MGFVSFTILMKGGGGKDGLGHLDNSSCNSYCAYRQTVVVTGYNRLWYRVLV